MAKGHHKGEAHEEHADESWLVPYADLLTLLLALFIVLFASSSVEEKKYDAVMKSLAIAFKGSGGADMVRTNPQGSLIPIPVPVTPSGPDTEDEEDSEGPEGVTGRNQMRRFYTSVQRYVQDNSLQDMMRLEFNGDNVLITLKSDIWFQSGSATVTEGMIFQARRLAQLLRRNQDATHPLEVVVTGHTDNVPIRTSKYPSNWYLSMDRAFNFLALLLENQDLDPGAFSARGYGSYRPIAPNGTPDGRQLNRRVEVMISRSHNLDPRETRRIND